MSYYNFQCPLKPVDLCDAPSNIKYIRKHLNRIHSDVWLPEGTTVICVSELADDEYEFVVANGRDYLLVSVGQNFTGGPLKFNAISLTNPRANFRVYFAFSNVAYVSGLHNTEIEISFLCTSFLRSWKHPLLLPVEAIRPLVTDDEVHLAITVTRAD